MPAEAHTSDIILHVPCAVLTISDTRTVETDKSGQYIRASLTAAGHSIEHYAILKDDPASIRETLISLIADPGVSAILLTGGTGLSARDTTYEVVDALLEKRLDGFGELFRSLSYAEIGSGAMLSRAVAGIVEHRYGEHRSGEHGSGEHGSGEHGSDATVLFSMPGSTGAVTLALQKLILPELPHIVHLISP